PADTMRQAMRDLVPSMFQRRLLLLLLAALAVAGILALQLFRLTIVRGADMRSQAEAALTEGYMIPQVPGQGLDRPGTPGPAPGRALQRCGRALSRDQRAVGLPARPTRGVSPEPRPLGRAGLHRAREAHRRVPGPIHRPDRGPVGDALRGGPRLPRGPGEEQGH